MKIHKIYLLFYSSGGILKKMSSFTGWSFLVRVMEDVLTDSLDSESWIWTQFGLFFYQGYVALVFNNRLSRPVHTLCHSFISTSDSSVVEGSINKLNDPSVNRVESASPEMFPILCMTLLKHALNTVVKPAVLPAEVIMILSHRIII